MINIHKTFKKRTTTSSWKIRTRMYKFIQDPERCQGWLKKGIGALLLSCFLLPVSALADIAGKEVKVNLIVFSRVTPQALASEAWTKTLIQPNVAGAQELTPAPIKGQTPVTNTPTLTTPTGPGMPAPAVTNDFKLFKKYKIGLAYPVYRLRKNGYKILLDVAWTQPADETNQWIHIYGGQPYDAQGQPLQDYKMNAHNIIPNDNATYWELNGLVRVSYNINFTASAKLFLTLPQSLGNINAQQFGLVPLMTYPLLASRKMRLNQEVYFDHPLFGALVLVSKAKTEKT